MSIFSKFRYLLPLFLIPIIVVFIWFNNGLIVGKGEEGLIFYNFTKGLELSKSVWVEVNTGMPMLSWLSRIPFFYAAEFLNTKLFLPQFLIQAGLFFILMLIGTLSAYYLTLHFLKDYPRRKTISLISALFYLLNPFSVSQVWGRALYPQFFSFALFPLSFLILVKALNKKSYFYLVPLLFSSVLLSWAYGLVTTVVCYWVILGLYSVWWLFIKRTNKSNIVFGLSFIIFSFLGWILVNAWWILTLVFEGNKVLSSYVSNPEENIGTLLGVSKSYPPDIIIRLLHKGYFFDADAYNRIYSTLPFQLISFIPVFFMLIGLIKTLKNQELRKYKFFVVIFSLGLVVSLGANPPIGSLFVWIFEHVTVLQAFRNPFEKFGLVYALGYAPLFALGLATFFKKGTAFWITIILFLTIGVYSWPMWTGKVLVGIDNKIGVQVPGYYELLNKWLQNNDTQDNRIVMTPLESGEASVFQWDNTVYSGVDPMHFILNRAAISNGAQIPFYYDFSQSFRKYTGRENLAPVLSLLRAKYLIDRRDMIKTSASDKNQYQVLTSAIYPPAGAESNLKTICQSQFAVSQKNNPAWINCRIVAEAGNLSGTKYLYLKVKTSEPANLEVALRDTSQTRIRWDGRRDTEYGTDSADWQYITIPLSTPTEDNSTIDLSKISLLEVLAHPKDKPLESVGEINLEEVKLDPGVRKEINEFKEIAKFGNLSVSKVANFNPPPEFGSLSSLDKVEDFAGLFDAANQKKDQTDKKGFVLTIQNKGKNLQDLPDTGFTQVVDKYKVSDSRYWVKTGQNQGGVLLILSKTFNPEWKVIAGISKEKLTGNLFDDLNLLRDGVLPEEKHFVVNGYANLWILDNSQDQLAIVFLPQIYADIGFKVSLISVGLLILISGLYAKKIWKH